MNRREKIVGNKAKKDGWEILTNGYPDLFLYKEKTNEVLFIEVKSEPARKKGIPGGKLSQSQKRMHQVLKNLGFTVKVVHIE
ncbi:MAG: VRR-NUC domain-containing protein [Candidatus Marinimicrobia bacterium]|nr:VRR-NUC domain-containing protein [Candidatus Neomarinimicrobiota bacterium]